MSRTLAVKVMEWTPSASVEDLSLASTDLPSLGVPLRKSTWAGSWVPSTASCRLIAPALVEVILNE